MTSLPEWSLRQHILAYRARDIVPKAAGRSDTIVVKPSRWQNRNQVAEADHNHLHSHGIEEGHRVPRGVAAEFVSQRLQWPTRCKVKDANKTVRQ